MTPERFARIGSDIEHEVARVIVGQEAILRGTLTCLIAGGHVLLEGVPGLGKTSLVRAFARVLGMEYRRVQFTPDLMPADITGTAMFIENETGRRALEFHTGPIFGNLILADEINRATPKTQSALLEAMQEHTVTVGGVSRPLPRPFHVLATQNPIEMEGTYPLPEAQLDRFLFKLILRYPGRESLAAIVRQTATENNESLRVIVDGETLLEMQDLARNVPMSGHVLEYAVRVVMALQPESDEASPFTRRYVRLGVSPRGAQALAISGRVNALLDGRYNLSIEDLRRVAHDALRHRLILNFDAERATVTPDDAITAALEHVRPPSA